MLNPGEEVRVFFFLGEGKREEGARIREKYSSPEKVDRVYAELYDFWEKKRQKLQIMTPNEGMNTMINIWTLYQAEINIMFSRFASFIEVGGRTGLGYRDTAQDSMTVPHSNPEKCRQRIVELLRGLVSCLLYTSCDFYFPGIYMKDEMVVGITASGLDHHKAKKVRIAIQKAMEEAAENDKE